MFMKPNRVRALTLSLSSLLALGAMCTTLTARAAEQPSVTVSYRDLNLARKDDVQRLYQRLQHAALAVCAPQSMEWPLPSQATQRCYDTALNAAVRQVPSSELLALYRSADHIAAVRGRG